MAVNPADNSYKQVLAAQDATPVQFDEIKSAPNGSTVAYAETSAEMAYFLADSSSDDDWQILTPRKNFFGNYIFDLPSGGSVNMGKKVTGTVKVNLGTGKVLIEGAEAATINCSDKGDTITVKDSSIKNLKGGAGQDKITIIDSTVSGDINTGGGNDSIIIKNSAVNNIFGAGGDDYMQIEDSIAKKIDGSGDDDTINIMNSEIENIIGGSGDDNIIVVDSQKIGTIEGSWGVDTIILENSKAKTVDGGIEHDYISLKSSTVDNLKDSAENNTISKTGQSKQADVTENLSLGAESTAIDISQNIAKKYTNRTDLTTEEIGFISALDYFVQNFENMQKQFQRRNDEDGVVADGYNFIKELLGLGISDKDIEAALKEQEQMVTELKDSINGKGDFKAVFEKWTGIKYSQEKMDDYFIKSQKHSLYASGKVSTEVFQEQLSKVQSSEDALELFTNYYGSQERAIEEFNKFFENALKNCDINLGSQASPFAFNYNWIRSCKIVKDENGELIIEREMPKIGSNEYEVVRSKLSDSNQNKDLFMSGLAFAFDPSTHNNYFSKIFEDNFTKKMGDSPEKLSLDFTSSYITTFGKSNSFQNLIDKYCKDQAGFEKKIASALQVGGIAMMAIGGIVTFVCPPAGAALMSAGKWTAIAGTFSDNALNLIDELTSENGLTKDELGGLIKETLTEVALLASGAGAGAAGNAAKKLALTATQSKTLALLADMGTDATLSLLSDLVITGEIDLTGEGISQLLSIITGLAGTKIEQNARNKPIDISKVDVEPGKPIVADAHSVDSLKPYGTPELHAFCQEPTLKLADLDVEQMDFFNTFTSKYPNYLQQRGGVMSLRDLASLMDMFDSFKGSPPDYLDMLINETSFTGSFIKSIDTIAHRCGLSADEVAAGLNSNRLQNLAYLTSDLGGIAHPSVVKKILAADDFEASLANCLKTNCEFEDYADLITKVGVQKAVDFYKKRIGICELGAEHFDFMNNKLNGAPSAELSNAISNFESKTGVKLYADNDISPEYVNTLLQNYEKIKASGRVLPKEVYLTNMLEGGTNGLYSYGKNPDAIFVRPTQSLAVDFLHEYAHLADISVKKSEIMRQTVPEDLVGSIEKLVSDYATVNSNELIAEIGTLMLRGDIKVELVNGVMSIKMSSEYMNFDRRGYKNVKIGPTEIEQWKKLLTYYFSVGGVNFKNVLNPDVKYVEFKLD